MKGYVKDPESTLDYTFNWEPWLDGDTITLSVWVVDSPIVNESESNTTLIATIFISGGVVGQNYIIKNTITTFNGRTDERSLQIRVRNR